MRHMQMEEHKLSYFSSKVIFKTIIKMENAGRIYDKHKISLKYLIATWPKRRNKVSKKNIIQIGMKNYFVLQT